MSRRERPTHCPRYKVNRRVPDFTCNLGFGHSDAHRDPVTGQRWGHPDRPYGLRREPAKVSNRSKTKHGVQWSDRPARH